jgi:hypothetical protein
MFESRTSRTLTTSIAPIYAKRRLRHNQNRPNTQSKSHVFHCYSVDRANRHIHEVAAASLTTISALTGGRGGLFISFSSPSSLLTLAVHARLSLSPSFIGVLGHHEALSDRVGLSICLVAAHRPSTAGSCAVAFPSIRRMINPSQLTLMRS